ncbi:MAG: ABC transporter ATP-binding protein [Treponema sp.]|jgi:putative ABC transport system ATP-binding protein|nr:ABC transporter ATP-binding protein [Treponema sp.]
MINVENLQKTYRTGKIEFEALKGVSFNIGNGEFSALAGASGSGKTTLLNLIGCLDSITAGEVLIDGEGIAGLDRKKRNHIRQTKVGFIFQAYNLIPVLTARENVALALEIQGGMGKAEITGRVDAMLKEVGLAGMEKRKPGEMSGGQQQRVSIARALVKEPPLVLADEPTANLDSKTSEEILELMAELNRKRRTTFLFSTHDQLVMKYVTRLIHIKDGLIQKDETKKQGVTA